MRQLRARRPGGRNGHGEQERTTYDARIGAYVWKIDKSLAGNCVTLKLEFADALIVAVRFETTK